MPNINHNINTEYYKCCNCSSCVSYKDNYCSSCGFYLKQSITDLASELPKNLFFIAKEGSRATKGKNAYRKKMRAMRQDGSVKPES